MSTHAEEIDLNGVAAYPANPQVVVPFQPDVLMFRVSDGVIDVDISLDGIQTFVIIKSTDINNLLVEIKDKQIWMKQASVGACKALVSAWTKV